MTPRKKLIIFSDLEGTLLREEDGQYDEHEMYGFLSQISKLQAKTGFVAEIHIVSPMTIDMMKKVIDKFDKTILRYNSIHRAEGKAPISYITGATASPESKAEECYRVDDRIMPLPKAFHSLASGASYGKEHYVRTWLETLGDKVGMVIYCGNGRNDIPAMKLVRSLPNGFIVCPKNSKTEIRNIASFITDEEDLPGITEGLSEILSRISKKEAASKDDDIEK